MVVEEEVVVRLRKRERIRILLIKHWLNVKPEQRDCLVLRHRVAAKSLTRGSGKLLCN